jgi:hypothetical protein
LSDPIPERVDGEVGRQAAEQAKLTMSRELAGHVVRGRGRHQGKEE